MSKGFQVFDLWLLENKFEKFAHWWQKLTGKDCFWLARISFALWVICFAGFFWLLATTWTQTGGFLEYILSFVIISALLTAPVAQIGQGMFSLIKECEQQAKRGQLQERANPMKLKQAKRARLWRIATPFTIVGFVLVNLFLLGASIVPMLVMLGYVGATHAMWLLSLIYFASCDPLPPGQEKSKIIQLLNSVREKFIRAPQQAPVPI